MSNMCFCIKDYHKGQAIVVSKTLTMVKYGLTLSHTVVAERTYCISLSIMCKQI